MLISPGPRRSLQALDSPWSWDTTFLHEAVLFPRLARSGSVSLFSICCLSQPDSFTFSPSVPNSLSSAVPEFIRLKGEDLKPASARRALSLYLPSPVAASWGQGRDASPGEDAGKWMSPGTAESASRESGAPGEAGELKREALVPSSLLSLDWMHTLRSESRQSGLQLGKRDGRSWLQGVLHFCGGRGLSLWILGVSVRIHWSWEPRPQGRLSRGPTGLPEKSGSSGSSGSSEATAGDRLLSLRLLLKARFRFGGWNHCTASGPACRCDSRTPLAAYVRKSRVSGRR